jgi:CheY-like chemotaxis protein
MKILIVDDVGYNRLLITRVLESHGHEIIAVTCGEDALRQLQIGTDIGLVITDYMMPNMNGIEFFKLARDQQRISDSGPVHCPPFILLTAVQDVSILREAKKAGYHEVLLKPLDVERLLKAIETVVTLTELEAELALDSCTDDRQTAFLQQLNAMVKQAIADQDSKWLSVLKMALENALRELSGNS